jgi:HAMP domain-containing protein
MTHDDLEETVPLYAIGALERIERQALEAHLLSGCIPCRTALKEFQSVAISLPFALNIVPPPRALKAKIMGARTQAPPAETATHPSATPSLEPGEWMKHLFPPSSPSTTSFGLALGMVFVGIVVLLMFQSWNSSPRVTEDTRTLGELQTQVDAANAQLTTLQQQLSEREELLTQTREELQRRMEELAELKDQLIHREAELDDLTAHLAEQGGHSARIP